ncbi:ABC transporter permease [Arenimonas sp. MALMAid1274]|uniref:ABC transporter permease n=1 Tax=Arenimonas sp. MALMAid1274 TaxID=3411630 RepID=UPI003BA28EE6
MGPALRAVFRELFRRELEERYRGSVLGALWLLLLPLLQLAVLAWVFGHLMPARAHGGDLPYAAFLALGLWPWNLFANAANRGVSALTDNAALIGKVAVPHTLYVDTRVAASAMVDVGGFALVVAVLLAFGVGLQLSGLPVALLGLAVVAVYALAVARLLAVLQVFLRDIATLTGQLLVLGFFLTPVLYDRSLLPATASRWLAINPLVAPVETVRAGLAGGAVDWAALGLSALIGAVLLVLATLFFRRARSHLEDFL